MAKALGIGGIFFQAQDPRALMAWYQRWLGFPADAPDYAPFLPQAMPPGSCSVFSPFPHGSDQISPSTKPFMFNLVVDHLDEALAQVQAGGASLVGEVQTFDYGRFGWFLDPEGHKVELWEPAEAPSTT